MAARRRVILALVVCALALCWGGVAAPMGTAAARPAGSYGSVAVMSPASSSGPVNTLLSIEVRLYPADPIAYALSVTTTSPDQNGCASAQPLSGAPTVQVQAPAGGAASFRWPASLGHGRYWLCAMPSGGTGPTAVSPTQTPFTVLTDVAPAVQTALISTGSGAYSGLTVTVTNWITDEGTPPQLLLLPDDGSAPGMRLDATLDATRSDPASGRYIFTMGMPNPPRSGDYVIAAEGDCRSSGPCAVDAYSASLGIVTVASYHYDGSSGPPVAPTPTAMITIHFRSEPISHPTSPLLWGWVIAALLVLLLLGLGLYAFRRMQ